MEGEAKETALRRSHMVILQEDTLDKILSFLPGKDWRTGRLVCQQWNFRILSNFHLKLAFKLTNKRHESVLDQASFLSTCDQKILRSISAFTMLTEELEFTLEHLRSSGNLRRLRNLRMSCIDERTLDFLIMVANQGELEGLEDLDLLFFFSPKEEEYKCLNSVSPGVLPELRRLKARPSTSCDLSNSEEAKRFRSEHLLAAIQSLVAAAPGLEQLHSSVPLDLKGRNVKRLIMTDCEVLKADEAIRMLDSVKKSMTFLSLDDSFPATPLPVKALLNVKALSADFSYISFADLKTLLPPTGKLRELKLTEVPIPELSDLPSMIEPFRLLFNARLDELCLEFPYSGFTISLLVSILQLVELEVEDETKSSRTLEFVLVQEENQAGDLIRDSAFILEKLGRRWSLVRFKNFRFAVKPNWTEKKFLIFEGRKNGLITIDDMTNPRSTTVILQITD